MPVKPGPPMEFVANRCRCGHFPTSHMVVRPATEGNPGSFALRPVGPCVRCGTACPKYTPSPA
jgi:hypothetical protein